MNEIACKTVAEEILNRSRKRNPKDPMFWSMWKGEDGKYYVTDRTIIVRFDDLIEGVPLSQDVHPILRMVEVRMVEVRFDKFDFPYPDELEEEVKRSVARYKENTGRKRFTGRVVYVFGDGLTVDCKLLSLGQKVTGATLIKTRGCKNPRGVMWDPVFMDGDGVSVCIWPINGGSDLIKGSYRVLER